MKKRDRKLIFDAENLSHFAANLKRIRKEKGYTQESLAYAANLSLSQIARIETARTNPTISTLFTIAKALNIHPSDLFEGMCWNGDVLSPQ